MTYIYLPLTQRQAERIHYDWQYKSDFAFYDIPNDPRTWRNFWIRINGRNITMLLWIVHN